MEQWTRTRRRSTSSTQSSTAPIRLPVAATGGAPLPIAWVAVGIWPHSMLALKTATSRYVCHLPDTLRNRSSVSPDLAGRGKTTTVTFPNRPLSELPEAPRSRGVADSSPMRLFLHPTPHATAHLADIVCRLSTVCWLIGRFRYSTSDQSPERRRICIQHDPSNTSTFKVSTKPPTGTSRGTALSDRTITSSRQSIPFLSAVGCSCCQHGLEPSAR